MLYTFYRKWEY